MPIFCLKRSRMCCFIPIKYNKSFQNLWTIPNPQTIKQTFSACEAWRKEKLHTRGTMWPPLLSLVGAMTSHARIARRCRGMNASRLAWNRPSPAWIKHTGWAAATTTTTHISRSRWMPSCCSCARSERKWWLSVHWGNRRQSIRSSVASGMRYRERSRQSTTAWHAPSERLTNVSIRAGPQETIMRTKWNDAEDVVLWSAMTRNGQINLEVFGMLSTITPIIALTCLSNTRMQHPHGLSNQLVHLNFVVTIGLRDWRNPRWTRKLGVSCLGVSPIKGQRWSLMKAYKIRWNNGIIQLWAAQTVVPCVDQPHNHNHLHPKTIRIGNESNHDTQAAWKETNCADVNRVSLKQIFIHRNIFWKCLQLHEIVA